MGPVMHETDQASLLSGAWQLAQGKANPFHAPFYNYDKQFLSYVWVALWLKLLPTYDPVGVGNLSTFLVFWSAVVIVLIRYRPRTWSTAAVAGAAILTPALWQHSAFLASNFLAAAFLLLGVCLWHPGRMTRKWLSLLLLGGAVLARADALAVLPLLLWSLIPSRHWLKNRWLWGAAVTGAGAFLLGRTLTATGSPDAYPLFFHPKIYAAYLVFGLGATSLILGFWTLRWLGVAWRQPRWKNRLHSLAGAAALLPIFGFYSLQMFSTRHWVTLIAVLIVLPLTRRGRVIFRSPTFAGIVLAGALIPGLIGIQMTTPTQVSLVLGPGTAFPSADGNLTMGGYLPQLREMKLSDFSHDHNQSLWLAARDADYHPNSDGNIPFLPTPMVAYYDLACELRGLRPIHVAVTADRFYVDSRSVLREAPRLTDGAGFTPRALGDSHRFLPVSASEHGYRMWLALPGSPSAEIRHLIRLADQFGGDEFRLLPDAKAARDPRWQGHRIVLLTESGVEEIPYSDILKRPVESLRGAAAVSVFPAFMSVREMAPSEPPAR